MPFFGVPIRNGLPIGLGSVAGFGVQQFDPLELFASGANGVWYDPSDTSTLFQDPAGTTPVTAVEQPVGLMLDKSKGLVLGSELVTNGDFATDTAWNKGTGWNIAGGFANKTAGTSSDLSQNLGLVQNRFYETRFTVTVTAGTIIPRMGTAATNLALISTSGTYKFVFSCPGSDGFLYFRGDASFVGSIDNISVKELPGNHAISYNSTTARPTLSARVNLLTYSEQFDNAAWTLLEATVSANQTTAPDGTISADKLIETTATSNHQISLPLYPATGTFTLSFYAKAAERNFAVITFGSSDNPRKWFNGIVDLSNGDSKVLSTINSPVYSNFTATLVGNGWYRISVQVTNNVITPGSTGFLFGINISDSYTPSVDAVGRPSYIGNGTSGIFIWGADLRPANIGSAVPSYQRIAAATDYDTNGFPKYLYFAGVDDGMSTPANLNLTSTDKVTVFSGVRKLSDAAAAVLTELSALIASNNGAFAILGPSSAAGNNLRFVSKGTIVAESNATAVSPISGVITGVGDISGDVCQFRFNGSVTQTTTTDQGTGDYGSYPLYIGARNNASGWFNGYLYGLTVVGAQLTTPQIESMESWTAQRTGITL